MFRRRVLPLWIGTLLLACMFLLGQEMWLPPCIDHDDDGYGRPVNEVICDFPELDCDDANADVHPGAVELCDGIDNQCPGDEGYGEVDEVCTPAVQIPAGCFDMGDSFAEGDAHELPVHTVCISAFEMDATEVTNAQYAACVVSGGCSAPSSSASYTRPDYYGNPAYEDFPVIHVNWYQANEYCTWAGKRLPTEAEWEYAARGGLEGKRYPRGDTMNCYAACYGRLASYQPCWDSCTSSLCDNDTFPVWSYPANGYGLHHMAGNVHEWTGDWYGEGYYQACVDNGIVNDPPGPATGTVRVLRGGSWSYGFTYRLRVAFRNAYFLGNGLYNIGFRCAR